MPETIKRVVESVSPRLFIGGEYRDSSDGGTFDVINPATGSVLAKVANGTLEDADAALDAAAAAAGCWAATPPRRRSEILRRAFDIMIERADELALLIVAENGKVFADARGEILYAAEFLRWYAEEAVRVPGSYRTAPSGNSSILVTQKPIGICILVTPWNFPAAMATRKIGPALAAGCTVVLKPASDTPLSATAIGGILKEAGLPDGVLNILPTRQSRKVIQRLVDDKRTRKLSFTGSTEVGVELLALASRTVVNTSMELGGNAPFIVFDDADIDMAVSGAMLAKMRNGGEACTSANRFYVQAGIVGEFTRRFAAAMDDLTLGDGSDPSSKLGPLINESAQIKIANLVADAVSQGARLVTGGSVPDKPGFYYPATVLADVPAGAEILQQEIFGPVAPIVTFESETEAIELANSTEFGLVAYVFTSDVARGMRVSAALESGMVGINKGLVSDPAAPFGGVKQSGIGREGGSEGLLEYLESQYVAVEW